MKESEALKLVATLKAAYPRQPLELETQMVYATFLADVDADAATRAVKRIVSSSKFFPTIAEIRELVAEEECGLPSVQEAVELVMARYSVPAGERPPLHPAVKRAVEAVGGSWAIRSSESPTTMRAQLRDAYAEIRREQVRQVQERPAIPQQPVEALAARQAPALPMPDLKAIT